MYRRVLDEPSLPLLEEQYQAKTSESRQLVFVSLPYWEFAKSRLVGKLGTCVGISCVSCIKRSEHPLKGTIRVQKYPVWGISLGRRSFSREASLELSTSQFSHCPLDCIDIAKKKEDIHIY